MVFIHMAEGYEEVEALTCVDVLRRAGIDAKMVSITGSLLVKGAHGINIEADMLFEDADYESCEMIVLPGGMPGTTHLGESAVVLDQCRAFAKDKYVAAICAAPSVLAGLGLLEGKPAACHPSVEAKMAGAVLTGKPVETAGNIITGKGLGAAIPFALELVRILTDRETADRIAAAICYGE